MGQKHLWLKPAMLATALMMGLGGCGSDDDPVVVEQPDPPAGPEFPEGAVFVEAGENLTQRIQNAFINASSDSVIVLPEGEFSITSTLQFDGDVDGDGNFAKNVTIMGYGRDKTILDFSDADSGDGVFVQNALDITISDLSVNEAKNNGIKLKNTNGIILRDLATIWHGDVGPDNGAYGLYPVECRNILIEDTYVRGSADAGIYVGQSEYIVVRNNIAELNVAGIEIENSKYADVYNNEAFDNTGGILVFDLPIGNQHYGSSVRVFNNKVYRNNTENFANASANPAGVHIVPPGTGIIVLSTDDVEIFNNDISDHDTMAITLSSFFIAEPDLNSFVQNYGQPGQPIADGWRAVPRNAYVHDNTISNAGANPNGYLITDIIAAYMGYHGAFPAILYDGLGEAMANSGAAGPQGYNLGELPFASDGSDNVCAANNTGASYGQLYDGQNPNAPAVLFEAEQANLMNCEQTSLPVHTVTFNGEIFGCGIDDNVAGCDGGNVIADDDDSGNGDGGLVGDGDLSLCVADSDNVNWDALLGANCSQLSEYNLFADATNPAGSTNGSGLPYDLNSPLFTDYASKYRYVFVPEGEKASFSAQESFEFPVGSVLVKTFALPADTSIRGLANETLIETRLLIHRATGWTALPFVWNADKTDAVLAKPGNNSAQTLVHNGESHNFNYKVPNIAECKQCHQLENDQGQFKFAPIGPKARFLNQTYAYADGNANQLSKWVSHGILSGVPDDLSSITSVPAFDDSMSDQLSALSDDQVMALAKGYLDINCAHCHRPEGNASNTGLKLEYWRAYDEDNGYSHGTCKQPIAYGGGNLGYDVVPGKPEESILHYRMDSDEPGDRMPEIGRALIHQEGVALIHEWISRLPERDCSN
ncbi:SO2930 family diheme c-type cytochrome [Ferrimonas kyonanensis]|uniref:SO2930 family diheme c-type cytochrome n=1 Tax=Ferrimonas kyonanensis TaxID=364763 RepID=UPI00041A3CEC|nr:SO2930 family diheme c-type cytochrome [Ferrimonas kyonanensis]